MGTAIEVFLREDTKKYLLFVIIICMEVTLRAQILRRNYNTVLMTHDLP